MTPSNAARLFVFLSVMLAAPQIGAEKALSISVTPQVASAPATVSIAVTVERHAENRTLLVEDDSDVFYRSSLVPLEGDQAARTYTFRFRGLPSGSHVIRATVTGSTGLSRATVHTTVIVAD